MTRATILVPTFNHADTLLYSIKSIQQQTLQAFEVFVVGDGAPARTDQIMADFCRDDPRIRYFPHPKGAAHGELYRHEALQQARGNVICYLGDDDLWLPHHLTVMCDALENADFVHSVHITVKPDQSVVAMNGSIVNAMVRRLMVIEEWNVSGPTSVAHTLDAYRKLPHGWRPRPEGTHSDLYMWR